MLKLSFALGLVGAAFARKQANERNLADYCYYEYSGYYDSYYAEYNWSTYSCPSKYDYYYEKTYDCDAYYGEICESGESESGYYDSYYGTYTDNGTSASDGYYDSTYGSYYDSTYGSYYDGQTHAYYDGTTGDYTEHEGSEELAEALALIGWVISICVHGWFIIGIILCCCCCAGVFGKCCCWYDCYGCKDKKKPQQPVVV